MRSRNCFLRPSYCLAYSSGGICWARSWAAAISNWFLYSVRVMMSSLTTATISSTTSWPKAGTTAGPRRPAIARHAMSFFIRPTSDS